MKITGMRQGGNAPTAMVMAMAVMGIIIVAVMAMTMAMASHALSLPLAKTPQAGISAPGVIPVQTETAPRDLTAPPGGAGINTSPTLRRRAPELAEDPAPDPAPDPAIDTPAPIAAGELPGINPANPDPDAGLPAIGNASGERIDARLWEGANMADILDLFEKLPPRIGSKALDDALTAMLLARAIPPEGEGSIPLLERRINWLKPRITGGDFATFLRALPQTGQWQEWHHWLVMHDLLTRNDRAACRAVQSPLLDTATTGKITAFCHAVAGDNAKARFTLDLLADLGGEDDDPFYFALMQRLLSGVRGQASPPPEDDTEIRVLHLPLMESMQMPIPRRALLAADAWRGSFSGLRHLTPDATALLAARGYDAPGVDAGRIAAIWKDLPQPSLSAGEALERFGNAETADDIAAARLPVWQAANNAPPESARAIARRALAIDFRYDGARALRLWLPLMGEDVARGMLRGLLPMGEEARRGLTGSARGWAEILAAIETRGESALTVQHVIAADAPEVMPLLAVFGAAPPEPLPPEYLLALHPPLAGNTALPYGRLTALEAKVADSGNPAEILMLAAVALGDVPPHRLARNDAMRLVAALTRAGFDGTARALAREVIAGWALGRELPALEAAGSDSSPAPVSLLRGRSGNALPPG